LAQAQLPLIHPGWFDLSKEDLNKKDADHIRSMAQCTARASSINRDYAEESKRIKDGILISGKGGDAGRTPDEGAN